MTEPQRSAALPEGAEVIRWALTPARDGVREWRPAWGSGEWDNEPDVAEWRKPGSALPRMAVRNNFGAWCGYVGLPPGHPLHGKGYDDAGDVTVHGGLTYANECAGHICHVARPGEPEHVWWLGFDTAHCYDFSPGLAIFGSRRTERLASETYRTLDYVIAETESLAAQLEQQEARA